MLHKGMGSGFRAQDLAFGGVNVSGLRQCSSLSSAVVVAVVVVTAVAVAVLLLLLTLLLQGS